MSVDIDAKIVKNLLNYLVTLMCIDFESVEFHSNQKVVVTDCNQFILKLFHRNWCCDFDFCWLSTVIKSYQRMFTDCILILISIKSVFLVENVFSRQQFLERNIHVVY